MRVWPRTTWGGLIGVAGVILWAGSAGVRAEASLGQNLWDALRGRVPHETAFGLYAGTAYDWSDLHFYLASWQVLFDYDAIWPHRAPQGLGIRVEGNVGAAHGSEFSGTRVIASGNFLAVYEFAPAPEGPERCRAAGPRARFVPYVEAGVGLIYTDFQREDQAYRVNFNPVAGLGLRTRTGFLSLRLHHLSNGGLNDDNRGINSVVLGFGVYLGAER
jgi:lipid A 3-O-deacylase